MPESVSRFPRPVMWRRRAAMKAGCRRFASRPALRGDLSRQHTAVFDQRPETPEPCWSYRVSPRSVPLAPRRAPCAAPQRAQLRLQGLEKGPWTNGRERGFCHCWCGWTSGCWRMLAVQPRQRSTRGRLACRISFSLAPGGKDKGSERGGPSCHKWLWRNHSSRPICPTAPLRASKNPVREHDLRLGRAPGLIPPGAASKARSSSACSSRAAVSTGEAVGSSGSPAMASSSRTCAPSPAPSLPDCRWPGLYAFAAVSSPTPSRAKCSPSVPSRRYRSRPSSLMSVASRASASCRQPWNTARRSAMSVVGVAMMIFLSTPNSDQRRVVLQRGGKEVLARQEKDHELRRGLELFPIRLARQGLDVPADARGVAAQVRGGTSRRPSTPSRAASK